MPILDRRKNRFIEDQDSRVSVGIDFPFARVPGGDGYFATTKTTISVAFAPRARIAEKASCPGVSKKVATPFSVST